MKVNVTLKSGEIIQVLPQEVPGLKSAGLLKEEKTGGKTKEDKSVSETKEDPALKAKKQKEANERMTPSKKRPVNIGSHSIKKG